MISYQTYKRLSSQFKPGKAWGPSVANIYIWSYGFEPQIFTQKASTWSLHPATVYYGY